MNISIENVRKTCYNEIIKRLNGGDTINLAQIRAGYGYTQSQMAKLLGVNQSTYNAWESLDIETVRKWAVIFGMDSREIEIPAIPKSPAVFRE